MLGLLNLILCTLRNILLAITWGAVEVLNALVLAIGALAGFLVSALPPMPDAPSGSGFSSTALGWIAWFVPVGGILAGLGVMLALYLLFRVAQVALRWVKAL